MKKVKGIRSRKMGSAHKRRTLSSRSNESENLPHTAPQDCQLVAVGKRRDGGTRYWCLRHKADATAKYGRPADSCRASRIPPLRSQDVLELDLDRYQGGIALWGAVPPVYDTTTLPIDRGIHVHARRVTGGAKEIDRTFRAVRILAGRLPKEGISISELDAIYYMVTSIFGYGMKHIRCSHCSHAHLDRDWFSVHPHRRHLCAGCGRHFRDSETSKHHRCDLGIPFVAYAMPVALRQKPQDHRRKSCAFDKKTTRADSDLGFESSFHLD
jgi:hypothetical protein